MTINVFDLDGVVTDPGSSTVSEPAVALISGLLESGHFAAVNTGRSYDWVKQHVLPRLAEISGLDYSHFAVSCEKGGSLITWSDGVETETPGSVALSTDIIEQVKQAFEARQADFPTMFWDATKRTMASIEKNPSDDLTVFHEQQLRLNEYLKTVLPAEGITIDLSNISTDIESADAGKAAGSAQLLQWVRTKTQEPLEFVSIGDSPSDYGMAQYFVTQNLPSTFVYVGTKSDELRHDPRVNYVATNAKFALGAIEYFAEQVPR